MATTGYSTASAESVVRNGGVDGVLVDGKAIEMCSLQDESETVATIGERRPLPLARTDIGVAVGTGTGVAIEAAGITLTSGACAHC